VAVVRAGLRLLEETTDREALRQSFRDASLAARGSSDRDLADLDHLASEGID